MGLPLPLFLSFPPCFYFCCIFYLKQKPHKTRQIQWPVPGYKKKVKRKELAKIITNKNAKSPKQQRQPRNSFHQSAGLQIHILALFFLPSNIFSSHSQITRNPFVRVNALVENAEKEII